MMIYIPDDCYNDIENKDVVTKILKSIPDTDLIFPGVRTRKDAIKEIRGIGEDEIADLIEK